MMYRRWDAIQAALHSDLASCGVIDIREFAGAAILIPTSVTGLTFNGCETEAGTYSPIHDNENVAVAPTVTAGKWFDFPAAVFAHGFLKIQSAGANATAKIVRKS